MDTNRGAETSGRILPSVFFRALPGGSDRHSSSFFASYLRATCLFVASESSELRTGKLASYLETAPNDNWVEFCFTVPGANQPAICLIERVRQDSHGPTDRRVASAKFLKTSKTFPSPPRGEG